MTLTIVKLDTVQINGTTLSGIQTASAIFGQQIQTVEQDGQPTKQHITDAQPEITFTSDALDTLLALNTSTFASAGVALNGTTGAAGWAADYATDAGMGTTGTKFLVPYGLLIPEELSVDDPQGVATLSCRAIGRSNDGATAPMSISNGQGLPAFTTGNSFGMGQVEYNGTAMDEVQRVSIRFGLEIKRFQGDGGIYSDALRLIGIRPEITITVPDMAVVAALTLLGTRQGDTDTEIYFRKFDPASTRIATPTLGHIKVTIKGNNSLMLPTVVQLPDNSEGMSEISYRPIWDGTNAQIIVTTAQAIS